MLKYATLDNFKAWCSGRSYQIPNISIIIDKYRFILISIDECILGKFSFRNDDEFKKAKRYLKQKQKILQGVNNEV